jgi:hypothetical protein
LRHFAGLFDSVLSQRSELILTPSPLRKSGGSHSVKHAISRQP